MQANASNPLFASSLHQVQSSLYDGKRSYLSDLPPQQIIEICLLFELHVPLYVKNWVWPERIRNAIPGVPIQSLPPPPPSSSTDKNEERPVMDALVEPGDKTNRTTNGSGDKGEETSSETSDAGNAAPKPPEDVAPQATEKTVEESAPKQTMTTGLPPPTPVPVASASAPTPTPMPAPMIHAGYPHQPYGYQTYPTASYYPHLWPHYPHMPYAVHPHPHPQSHLNIHPPAAATTYQPSAAYASPTFTNQAQTHTLSTSEPIPPHPREDDNMPSYEDMIVEALIDSNDADGVAPKDIYAWMQTHYPVQSNFRPSASQALQKAYKRGRFEKGSNGKYRLNPSFSGNSTITRKPTRRPQHVVAQNPPSASGSQGPRPPPFTHAPLNRPLKSPFSNLGAFSVFGIPPQQPPQAETEVDDAYEAAQHILKAINFGEGLLSLNGEEGEQSSVEQVAEKEWEDGVRAQLQAQLALLAAQLQEYAQEAEAEEIARRAAPGQRQPQPQQSQPPIQPQPQFQPHIQPQPPPQPQSTVVAVPSPAVAVPPDINMGDPGAGSDEDDEDMDEVIIP